jgi:hypothetical protein
MLYYRQYRAVISCKRGRYNVMKGKLFPVVALIAALFLGGCVSIRVETKINPDFSGEKRMTVAMDDSFLDMAKSMTTPEPGATPEDPFADFKKSATDMPGARVEDFHDDAAKQTGATIIVPFANLNELIALSETGPFSNTDKVEVTQSGDTATMQVTMNMGSLTSEMGAAAAGAEGTATPAAEGTPEPQAMEQMAKMFEFTYAVAPAGQIVDYSPKEGATFDQGTNQVAWKLDLTAKTPPVFKITWKPGGVLPMMIETPAAPPAATAPPAVPPAATVAPAVPPVATALPAVPPAAPQVTIALPKLPGGRQCCTGCLPGLVIPLGGAGLLGLWGRRKGRST